MADIVKLQRAQRANLRRLNAAVRRVTEAVTAASEAESKVDARIQLDTVLSDMESELSTWTEGQLALEELLEGDEFDKSVDDGIELRDSILKTKHMALATIAKLQADSHRSSEDDDDDEKSESGESASSKKKNGKQVRSAKLERLPLPTFSGDVTEWQGFWEQFEANVHLAEDFPASTKFSHLKRIVKDDAARAIQGLSLTEAHYEHAIELLQERFGRKELLIAAHVQGLLSLNCNTLTDSVHSSSEAVTRKLREMLDAVNGHVRSLECLEVKGDTIGVFLTTIIVSRLPPDIKMEWARQSTAKEADLDFLLKFVKSEIESRERASAYGRTSAATPVTEKRSKKSARKASAAALTTTASAAPVNFVNSVTSANDSLTSPGTSDPCPVCKRSNHAVHRCYQLTKASLQDRRDRMMAAGLCFRCLAQNHRCRDCPSKVTCSRCNGAHHVLWCGQTSKENIDEPTPQGQTGRPNTNESSVNVVCNADNDDLNAPICKTKSTDDAIEYVDYHVSPQLNVSPVQVIQLQTVKATLHGNKGPLTVTVLFDTGSETSFIRSQVVKDAGLTCIGQSDTSFVSFGGKKSRQSHRDVFRLPLGKFDCPGALFFVEAVEMQVICAPLKRPSVPSDFLSSLTEFNLAETPDFDAPFIVDILVGLDFYWTLMTGSVTRVSDHAVVHESVFGHVLSGKCAVDGAPHTVSPQLLNLIEVPEALVRSAWELDAIGISQDKEGSCPDAKLLDEFAQSVTYDGERYSVALPWKKLAKPLQNNYKSAEIRLKSTVRRLERDPVLAKSYDAALDDLEAKGFVHEVPVDELKVDRPTFYLPHRPVLKLTSASTRVRPVFDASACGPNGVSLNSCLEAGPCLLPDLVEVLIRFRRWKIAITADIQKAFLQVGVHPDDRDVHRFLRMQGDQVRIMRFSRVPFGNKSSPFLLNATIRNHLLKHSEQGSSPRVVSELRDNLYVDDWLSGADTDHEAIEMFSEARTIMKDGGFPLVKWSSNSTALTELLTKEYDEPNFCASSQKILGVEWTPDTDEFAFHSFAFSSDLIVTKRVLLSMIARVFDPLGFLSPFVMTLKILFQSVWQKGLEWDCELPPEMAHEVYMWLNQMKELQNWKIQRHYLPLAWHDLVENLEVHIMCDASEKAYGCVAYLRSSLTGEASLVMSRARVAPLKRLTVPKLELMGALLASRMLKTVLKALRLPFSVPIFIWTDSEITLSWIKGDPGRWKPFVANRVLEIQATTDPANWRHCKGTLNTADLMTRGLSASGLMESNWLTGPDFGLLMQSPSPSVATDVPEPLCLIAYPPPPPPLVFDVTRWSHWLKTVLVVAYVYRFLKNCQSPLKQDRTHGSLTAAELHNAEEVVVKQTQQLAYHEEIARLQSGKEINRQSSILKLNPFLDPNGVLRVGGRLQMSDLPDESKHPVILPKGQLSLLLARFMHVSHKHAGVNALIVHIRMRFWIVGLRRIVKRVKHECVSCRRHDSKPCAQVSPPLPASRVSKASPFSIVGLDFAGPLYCSDSPQKFYVLLFTCAVVRAVHLELTSSLSLQEFLLAFRRFCARRGRPSIIYSDNATTFKGADVRLTQLFGPNSPQWRFIAPGAPWWGGWWERLVRSVKSALRKSLGRSSLPCRELETVLFEIECCLNCRPLTFVEDNKSGQVERVLTPSHFLLGKVALIPSDPLQDVPGSGFDRSSFALLNEAQQKRATSFWKQWSDDYLKSLPHVVSRFKRHGSLKVGSVVIVREEGLPRVGWPLGVVVEVFRGRDGLIRAVKVRTSKGQYVKPIQKLHDLEVHDESADSTEVSTSPPRARREVKAPDRLTY